MLIDSLSPLPRLPWPKVIHYLLGSSIKGSGGLALTGLRRRGHLFFPHILLEHYGTLCLQQL
jgi:hypothetical protein